MILRFLFFILTFLSKRKTSTEKFRQFFFFPARLCFQVLRSGFLFIYWSAFLGVISAALIATAHCVFCSFLFIIRLLSSLNYSGLGAVVLSDGHLFCRQFWEQRVNHYVCVSRNSGPLSTSAYHSHTQDKCASLHSHTHTHTCGRTPALILLPGSPFVCTIMTYVWRQYCKWAFVKGRKKDNHPWLPAALLHIYSRRSTCFISEPVALSLDLTANSL